MSTEIYYFSGTGNSLVVARDIAAKMNGKLIPIASVINQESIKPEADVIGIVFPVYYIVNTGLPLVIGRFVNKLENIGSKYIFAVCTCGGGSGAAITNLRKMFKPRGGKLAAGFTVIMPSNVSRDTTEKQQKNFNQWKEKLEFICEYVGACKEGKYENSNIIMRLMFAPLIPIMKPLILSPLKKLANSPENLPFEELIQLSDKSYYTNEKCDGCGTCVKVCPVNNIEMVDKKPSWLHHCETCLACFDWCPNEAICGGLTSTLKNYRYRHPEIKVSEMMRRNY